MCLGGSPPPAPTPPPVVPEAPRTPQASPITSAAGSPAAAAKILGEDPTRNRMNGTILTGPRGVGSDFTSRSPGARTAQSLLTSKSFDLTTKPSVDISGAATKMLSDAPKTVLKNATPSNILSSMDPSKSIKNVVNKLNPFKW